MNIYEIVYDWTSMCPYRVHRGNKVLQVFETQFFAKRFIRKMKKLDKYNNKLKGEKQCLTN